jgi:hypothetical protein
MDGDLEPFIEAFLKQAATARRAGGGAPAGAGP